MIKNIRVAGDTIMNGSQFPSGRKGIICAGFGDLAAIDAIFATSRGSLGAFSLTRKVRVVKTGPLSHCFH